MSHERYQEFIKLKNLIFVNDELAVQEWYIKVTHESSIKLSRTHIPATRRILRCPRNDNSDLLWCIPY